ncbi:DUF2721 domain-containing protein [Oleiharenicola sp. Vm1]|uniref:DUF2721 domain-containing protein n=1 Tax=Oleiharenicola sp. Vm1 TaxID=3398393 RepID=UPI0039F54D88
MESLSSLLPIIQLAITPVILVSGMGALLIVLTNRMGRIVDRTRQLAEAIPSCEGEERQHLADQLDIMWERSLIIRRAVTTAGLSMLLSCLLIVALFCGALLDWRMREVVLVLFGASIALLVASLVQFLRDIFMALQALRLQIDRAKALHRGAAPTVAPRA